MRNLGATFGVAAAVAFTAGLTASTALDSFHHVWWLLVISGVAVSILTTQLPRRLPASRRFRGERSGRSRRGADMMLQSPEPTIVSEPDGVRCDDPVGARCDPARPVQHRSRQCVVVARSACTAAISLPLPIAAAGKRRRRSADQDRHHQLPASRHSPKPATVNVDVVRAGRSITNLAVTLTQSAKIVLVSQVTAAEGGESTAWDTSRKLDLRPIEQCVPIAPPDGIGHFAHGVAMLDPADLPFSHGPRARVAGYMRPIEPRPIDASWLGMALDWFPPASFTRIDPPAGGISISYTIHVHRTLDRTCRRRMARRHLPGRHQRGRDRAGEGLIADPAGRILAESFHTRWTAGPDQLSVVAGTREFR